MQKSFIIQEFPAPAGFRVVGFVLGTLLIGSCVFMFVQTIGMLSGAAPSPSFFVLMLTWLSLLAVVALGGLGVRVFFSPVKTAIFEEATQQVRATFAYPFGIKKEDVFDLDTVATPEIVWQRNSDVSDNGYWVFKVTLPDGRKIKRAPDAFPAANQMIQAQEWLAEIEALRH